MDVPSTHHFLSLPRPDTTVGPPVGVVDTTTLAAHDFDVDNRTGFMPPQPPLARLPHSWEAWEIALDNAMGAKLQLGHKSDLSATDKAQSETWRSHVRHLPIFPTAELSTSEVVIRRAHHVLAWIMHFYIHSLPPEAPVVIPASITVPLLQVCTQLQLPPVITYSDDVLYNWSLKVPSPAAMPALDNLQIQSSFTGTKDEAEFYLCSARIELRGVEALELMRATMDEVFVGDAIAVRRITAYLHRLAAVIGELTAILLAVREYCSPETFYRDIRPWFRGADADGSWTFDGIALDPGLRAPTELSGASAGQSSLIHALDIFLGVDRYSHASQPAPSPSATPPSTDKPSFLDRMQSYMPRHHRGFLQHLSSNPRPLRGLVISADDAKLLQAYNAAVLSLKEFRDAHMIIVTLYIVGPAGTTRRQGAEPLKGTGGTPLARFLKGVRDQTAGAIICPEDR